MSQVDRYNLTRSFACNKPLLDELAEYDKTMNGQTLNKNCSTCVRNAMRRLCAYIESTKATPKITFKGIKQEAPDYASMIYNNPDYASMSYNQLKRAAKNRGIKLDTPTKAELIKALS